jgi:hypothetical protein
MSRRINLLFIICVLIFIALGYNGCKLSNVSMEDRMSHFATDLNSADRTSLYLNLHPDAAVYNARKDPATWDSAFGTTYNPHAFTNLSVNEDMVTGTWSRDGGGGEHPFKCQMKEDGFDGWFIFLFQFAPDDVTYQTIIQ